MVNVNVYNYYMYNEENERVAKGEFKTKKNVRRKKCMQVSHGSTYPEDSEKQHLTLKSEPTGLTDSALIPQAGLRF